MIEIDKIIELSEVHPLKVRNIYMKGQRKPTNL